MRLGVELAPDMTIAKRIDHAQWAEAHGFDDVWTPEIGDPDPFAVLAAVSQHVSRVRMGTMIAPIGTRAAPTLASSAATLSHLTAGRFVLGLGVSTQVVIEKWNGMAYRRPLGRARETVLILRSILHGETTNVEGEHVSSSGFKLRFPLEGPTPIALAALNVGMLELAGELADGVWLNFVPIDGVQRCLDAIDRGVARAGRTKRPEILISMATQVTATAEDAVAAREAYRRWLYFYMTAPPYQKAFSWHGFGDDVERAREARARGDKASVLAAVPARLAESTSAFGTADFCRARFEEFAAAGVDTAVVKPFQGDVAATLRAFAKR